MADMRTRKGGDTPSPPKRKKISEVTPPDESCVMISPTENERSLSKRRGGHRDEAETFKEQESSSEMLVTGIMYTPRVARRRKSPRKGSGISPSKRSEKSPSKSPEKGTNKSPEKSPVERETGGGYRQGRVRPGNARRKLDF